MLNLRVQFVRKRFSRYLPHPANFTMYTVHVTYASHDSLRFIDTFNIYFRRRFILQHVCIVLIIAGYQVTLINGLILLIILPSNAYNKLFI